MTTNVRYRMIDDMLTSWLAEIEDEVMLEEWVKRIKARYDQLALERKYTAEELVASYRECEYGDVLYLEKRYAIGETKWEAGFFIAWQPRVKRLWVRFAKRHDGREKATCFNERDFTFYQPARVDLATRRRAISLSRGRGLK